MQLVAVSVDGPPAEHAAIRNSSHAFAAMADGLKVLRAANVPFSLAFTLTQFNADRLTWLYDFANEAGAMAIHVHPLCNFGAASGALSHAVPDSREMRVAAWLLALLADQHGPGGPAVTLDAIPRAVLEESCWPMLRENDPRLAEQPFSDLVPSLIVESDGCIVPFIYGFPRAWQLGFLGRDSLLEAAERWRASLARPLSTFVSSVVTSLIASEVDYVDLFAALLDAAWQRDALRPKRDRCPDGHPSGLSASPVSHT